MTDVERKRPDWTRDAECRGMNPDVFFPPDGLLTPEAQEACGRCPVWRECREFGLYEQHGIWGGLTLRDRQRLIKARRKKAA